MRFEGFIKSWNEERGFGFVEPAKGGQDIFVHVRSITPRVGALEPGTPVSFEVELNPEGKKRARNVRVVRPARPLEARYSRSPARWGTASYLSIALFLIVYVVVDILWRVPRIFIVVYLFASVACFAAYVNDKAAAARRGQRTPEGVLLFLGFACGWPGAVLAQQIYRHKSNKAAFRSSFWQTVLANIAAFIFFSSPFFRRFWT